VASGGGAKKNVGAVVVVSCAEAEKRKGEGGGGSGRGAQARGLAAGTDQGVAAAHVARRAGRREGGVRFGEGILVCCEAILVC
jgi:hypothetical protein